jgi:hypothetical protein
MGGVVIGYPLQVQLTNLYESNFQENMKEKASALNPHNLSGIGSNLMGGITNLIPGRKEEEVPTPPEAMAANEMGGEMMMEGEQEYPQE